MFFLTLIVILCVFTAISPNVYASVSDETQPEESEESEESTNAEITTESESNIIADIIELSDEKLPQTGNFYWQIPVFASIGGFMIIICVALIIKKKLNGSKV